MVFSLNEQKINNFPTLYLNGIELKKISKLSPISNIRMLGILFDQNLNFTQFAEKTLAKISKYFFIYIYSDNILESNVREVKVHSPDYKGVEAEEAITDFLERIKHYDDIYEPISEETENQLWIKDAREGC